MHQHGADFAGDAAVSSLLGLVSLAAFAVAFARAARRFGWPATLAASWAAVPVVDAALSCVHVTGLVALALTLAATVAAMLVMPRVEPERSGQPTRPPSGDVLERAPARRAPVSRRGASRGCAGRPPRP